MPRRTVIARRRRGRRTIRSALPDPSEDGGIRGRKDGARASDIVAIRVAVIRLVDAQGGVALDDGVGIRERSGGYEGEMEKGEQKKVTSGDRHSEL